MLKLGYNVIFFIDTDIFIVLIFFQSLEFNNNLLYRIDGVLFIFFILRMLNIKNCLFEYFFKELLELVLFIDVSENNLINIGQDIYYNVVILSFNDNDIIEIEDGVFL